jgi:hypothetical protein
MNIAALLATRVAANCRRHTAGAPLSRERPRRSPLRHQLVELIVRPREHLDGQDLALTRPDPAVRCPAKLTFAALRATSVASIAGTSPRVSISPSACFIITVSCNITPSKRE